MMKRNVFSLNFLIFKTCIKLLVIKLISLNQFNFHFCFVHPFSLVCSHKVAWRCPKKLVNNPWQVSPANFSFANVIVTRHGQIVSSLIVFLFWLTCFIVESGSTSFVSLFCFNNSNVFIRNWTTVLKCVVLKTTINRVSFLRNWHWPWFPILLSICRPYSQNHFLKVKSYEVLVPAYYFKSFNKFEFTSSNAKWFGSLSTKFTRGNDKSADTCHFVVPSHTPQSPGYTHDGCWKSI